MSQFVWLVVTVCFADIAEIGCVTKFKVDMVENRDDENKELITSFINDFVTETLTTDVVLISSLNDTDNVADSLHSVSMIQFNVKELKDHYFKKLRSLRIDYNIQPLYIVISSPEDDLLSTMTKIRSADYLSPIIMIETPTLMINMKKLQVFIMRISSQRILQTTFFSLKYVCTVTLAKILSIKPMHGEILRTIAHYTYSFFSVPFFHI